MATKNATMTRFLALEVHSSATKKLMTMRSSKEGMKYNSTNWTAAGPMPTKISRAIVLTETMKRETKASARRKYRPSDLFLYAFMETIISAVAIAARATCAMSPK